MSDGGYKIRNRKEVHFVTFAVVVPIAIGRVDVFTGKEYRDILINSIGFCQRKKDLLLHCWCIMSNHVHLIASAKNEDLSDILRDFKKFTSKKIITAIENHDHESRKNWMLKIFNEQGKAIAGIKIINSGGRITSHRNYTVQ